MKRHTWVKLFLRDKAVPFCKEVHQVLCISNLSQMKVHFFNGQSNEVKVDTTIDVLVKIHATISR